MMPLPPSPAVSACDSLADIDDLEAFLEAQGELSHWPTPPPTKDEIIVTTQELDCDGDVDDLEDYHVAQIFTEAASIEVDATPEDVDVVQGIVFRSQLPREVLALAYNIVAGLSCQDLSAGTFYSTPSDLLVASVLGLAYCYTSDHPRSFSHWARHLCHCTWTAARIDKTMMQILQALDYRLHAFSSGIAIQQGLEILSQTSTDIWSYSPSRSTDYEPVVERRQTVSETLSDLKIAIGGTSSCWSNGQVTPDGTPPASVMEETGDDFLPLI